MFDYANQLMKSGFFAASERIAGVNDNMTVSHYHDFFEIYYLESGERFHLMENNLHLMSPGQFIIFEPYQLHHSYGDQNVPFSRLLLYFHKNIISPSTISQLMKGISGIYQLDSTDNASAYYLMNQILVEQQIKRCFYQENMIHLINQLLILILRNKGKKETVFEKNKVTDIISFINLNYMQKITLQQLSEQFFVSQYHLCREFKYYTNITITQYINNIRIIQAQKMLLEGNKKISEIGSDVGFDSLTHFGRVFKQITGNTPSHYKRQTKSKIRIVP